MENVRPTIFTYLAVAALGLPFLASIISSQSPLETPAPLPLISVFIFGYKPALSFIYSPFINMLTWLDYSFCVLVITMPFEVTVQYFRSKRANKKVKSLNEVDFQSTGKDDEFLLWLRPFSLDNRISIYSLPEIPNAVYVAFSERTRSIPLFPSEVNLYDMFRSFSKHDVIHISEGENNLPGGGGITYGDGDWQLKVELAIKNARTVVFQPFDTPAMDFEFSLLKEHRGLDDVIFFFPIFRTEHPERKLFRERMKQVEHLRYYYNDDPEQEVLEISSSIERFCRKNGIEHPDDLPFPSLIRYHGNGKIDSICSLYFDRKTIRNFIVGIYENEGS